MWLSITALGEVDVWPGPWVISFDSGSSVKARWITSQRLSRAQSEEMHACRLAPNAPANLNQHHKSLSLLHSVQ